MASCHNRILVADHLVETAVDVAGGGQRIVDGVRPALGDFLPEVRLARHPELGTVPGDGLQQLRRGEAHTRQVVAAALCDRHGCFFVNGAPNRTNRFHFPLTDLHVGSRYEADGPYCRRPALGQHGQRYL